jgi:hypothetical protein
MAVEYVFEGFEAASLAVFDDFAGPPTFPSGVARTGTYCARIAPPGGVNNFGIFPVGSVVGVGSAGAKKVVVRCYMRINAFPDVPGSQQESHARVLSVGGPQNGHAVLWVSGDPTSRSGVVLERRFGLSVNTLQGFGPPPSAAGGLIGGTGGLGYDGLTWSAGLLTTGVWYEVILRVSYAESGGDTVVTASVSVGGASLTPVGYTPPVISGLNIPPGQVAIGNNGSDWDASVSVDFDDVQYFAADGADGTLPLPPAITIDPPTLPDAKTDSAFEELLTATGGFGEPYIFAVIDGSLPPGLSLSSTGLLFGTPTTPGVYTFTVQAMDESGETGEQEYTVPITGIRYTVDEEESPGELRQADFELGLNQRSTAHLVFGHGYIPDRGAEIVLYARDGVTPVFGGIVLTRNVHGIEPHELANNTDVECVDFSVYFDDASVTLSYTEPVAVEDVIADVVDQVLGDYGLTYTPVATGLTMQPFSWVDVVVTTAFKQISDKTGMVFRTTPTKAIDVFRPGVPYFSGTEEEFFIQQAEYYRWVPEGDARLQSFFSSGTLTDYAAIVEGAFLSVIDGMSADEHASLVTASDALMWGPEQGFSGSETQWFLQQLEFERFVPEGDPRRPVEWPLSPSALLLYSNYYTLNIAPGLTTIIGDMAVDEKAALDAGYALAQDAGFVGTEEQFFLQQAEYARWMPEGDARLLTFFYAPTLSAYDVLMGTVDDDLATLLDSLETGDRAAVAAAYARSSDAVSDRFTGSLEQLLIQQAEYYRYLQEGDGRLLAFFSGATFAAYEAAKASITADLTALIAGLPGDELAAFNIGYAASLAGRRAPIAISDANINTFDLNWTDGDRLTANTVELFCGPSGPGQMRQQWIADGIESSWVTDLPAIDPPPILVEIDDGVTPYLATVVPLGAGGGQFEWDRETHTLSLGTDPLPAAGTIITLGSTENFDSPFTFYTVQFPFKVRVTTGELPPITYRESRPDCVEYAAGVELANGILDRESAPRRNLDVLTDVDGFLPGQSVTVNTTARGGLSAEFLVASVSAHLQNAEVWDYTIGTQEASTYRGSYVDEWKALTQGGGAAGSDATPVAPVTPPPPTAGTGDVTGPSASVDGEAVLFDGNTGKLLQRATGTGIAMRTSGVESVLSATPRRRGLFLLGLSAHGARSPRPITPDSRG